MRDLTVASYSSILRRNWPFSLDESGFPSAVNNTFLSFRVRDKSAYERTGNEENCSLINLVVVVLLAAVTAEAQQSTKIPRIGYLSGGFPSSGAPRIDGFRQGLGALGYVEGKNIVIESRHAEEKPDRIPALAAELVRLKVEVIVTGGGGGATRAAKEATKTIPIVRQGMSTLSDRGP